MAFWGTLADAEDMRRRQRALRALGVVVRRLALKYGLLRVQVTSKSVERDVVRVYRRLCKRVHLDNGGATVDFQDLDGAYQHWRSFLEMAGSGAAGDGAFAAPEP